MFGRVVRVLWGFALASLVAAATLVLFVYAPGDWAGLRGSASSNRLAEAIYFTFAITPHVIVWAAVPGLIAAIFAERYKIAGLAFYAFAGIGTAAVGYFLQLLTGVPDSESILQSYALAAFLTSGLIGGFVYWAASGRFVAKAAAKPSA